MNKTRLAVAVMAMGSMAATSGCRTEFVTPVVASSVMVAPQDTSIVEGEDLRFTATVMDELDQPVARAVVTWTSTDSSIVRVDPDGRAWGLTPGATVVWASFNGAAGSALMTVAPLECEGDGLTSGVKPKKKKDDDDDDDDEPRCSPPAGAKTP